MGIMKIPDNLERNGLNSAVETLTLGEINNHVLSITKELERLYRHTTWIYKSKKISTKLKN